jgi:hypothetical protein
MLDPNVITDYGVAIIIVLALLLVLLGGWGVFGFTVAFVFDKFEDLAERMYNKSNKAA